MILVVAEERGGGLHPLTWETVAAAQQAGGPVKVAVVGAETSASAAALASADVAEVLRVEAPALESYTQDGFVAALAQVIGAEQPDEVYLPHTYQARDLAPALAVRTGRPLVTDCVAVKSGESGRVYVRPVFQGRLLADVVADGSAIAAFQAGAVRADSLARRSPPAPIRLVEAAVDPGSIRQRPEAPFRESRQAVDLSQAERIVAVGRGIKEREQLALATELAAALEAEIGASRPICDAGWLPMDRQIGSSGQTVAPKLYVALGISGAIQHLVGMKGARTIVAVNKDPEAPIFEIADYGVSGDLLDIVPAVVKELKG
ncbi:MAG TPA: electron transfer flavoprotein subunit alpha/FixB family protein [Vicinamibacterales bacterium]|nr:electron transfer flavoprotein subunit alpha/FixB family protein [Vicinamibacterales bacterium]HPK72449.1 electron transfer flavoprotein subunit alpha/FixB family protein [Vicinamibacterales bacterium]